MDFRDFTSGKDDDNRRIDKIIRKFVSDMSLSEIYKAIRKGLIKINGKKCKPDTHVYSGDVISIASFFFNNNKNESNDNESTSFDENKLEIIFENENLLIINKPYNINVHGDIDSLDKQILAYYNSKQISDSLSFTPGPLHRLDKKTTGLLAFSFSLKGAKWFSDNIQDHSIHKTYFAIVQGKLLKTEHWEDLITNHNEDSNGFHKVLASDNQIDQKSKIAVTEIYPIAYGKYFDSEVTFARISIKTGRKHQIRAQCAKHNHPLIGDTTYGGMELKKSSRSFYLHAGELSIPENTLGLPEKLVAPLSKDFISFLKCCGIEKIVL